MGKSTEPHIRLRKLLWELNAYRAMRRAEQRHSQRRIAKPPELSELLPQFGTQFGTISMKDDRGKKAEFAHVNPMT